jgi:cytochrome P450 family 142 subfamily A polypeptide 1
MNEILRYCNPTQGMARTVTRDIEIGGREIPAGSRVALMFGAGCRDESVFPDPDKFIIGREPTPHLAFGWGIHRCLGEQFAKLEIKIVLEAVLARIPDFELAGDLTPALWASIGFHSLPVRFAPAKRVGVDSATA